MALGDQIALQHIFVELIKLSKDHLDVDGTTKIPADASLQLTAAETHKNVASIFSVFSHDNYRPVFNDTKVSSLNSHGQIEECATHSDVTTANKDAFDTAHSEIFEKATGKNGVAGYVTKSGQVLNVQFIPSNDPVLIPRAAKVLEDFLKAHGIQATIGVTNNYEGAAKLLKTGRSIDAAFLPVET